MAQDKHTPGPWVVEDPMGADVGLWIVQGGLETYQWSCIATVPADEDKDARDAGGRFIGRSEQRANAALIAASPVLLERATDLIEILDDFRGDFTDPAFIDALELLEAETREAIAKAGA